MSILSREEDIGAKLVECPICHTFISTKAILENHCKLVHDRKFEDFSRKIMLEEEGPEGEVFENDLPDVDYKGAQSILTVKKSKF
mgnify:FL=1